MPTETDKAWMAGFLDGEGHLNIAKQIRKQRPSPAYRPYVCVSNTNREVLTHFLKEHGGAIYKHYGNRSDKTGMKWSDAYAWYCPIKPTRRLLEDTICYYRLKRGHAEAILEFLERRHPFARRERTADSVQQVLARRSWSSEKL